MGVIAVPIILGYLAYTWNSERNEQQAVAERLDLAIQILQEPDGNDELGTELRDWAALVVQNTLNGSAEVTTGEAELANVLFDAEICATVRPYFIELALVLVEEGSAEVLAKGRDVIAVMDAICSFRNN